MDVEQVVTDLYGLRPAEFTAARDGYAARARQEKNPAAARRIAALRKPTLALWSAGLFARARPADAQALLRLGAQLRTAHRELDGAQLRALSHEQHRVIGALAREAVQLAGEAGERISASVLREIEQIFHALLVDEEAGRQWRAGRLTSTPTAPVGFEDVAPEPGAAPPSPAAASRTPPAPSTPPTPPGGIRQPGGAHGSTSAALKPPATPTPKPGPRTAGPGGARRAAAALEQAQGEAAAVREELHAVQLRLEAAEKAAAAARSSRHRVEAAAGKAGRRRRPCLNLRRHVGPRRRGATPTWRCRCHA
ncbi:hypothetical protein ACIRBY_16445 [Streptomyces sp. NPDC096136]|uniref:hypothetical protein n=1 Tax=Streptomyces sp. NPDC096136 TaxID=3366076 RepID=UPI0038077E20